MNLLPFPVTAPRRLLLAFSGGRDSTALLHRLATATDPPWDALRAVHVDHGLHPDSAAWAQHCTIVAAELGVPLATHRVRVERGAGGIEAVARAARLAAFATERRDDECLVLAHHRDDQAETLLLALLRGSGERGLAAMRPYLVDARGPVWRPLLDAPVDALRRYAESHALRWIDDPSNADTSLARNALRHEVLPLLRRRWPQADAALARSAALLAEADALLQAQAERDLAAMLGLDTGVLELNALHALSQQRATRALRAWATMNSAVLTSNALMRVFGEWRNAAPGRALRHAQGTHWLRQWQGRLWLTSRQLDEPSKRASALHLNARPVTPMDWDGSAPVVTQGGGILHLLGTKGFDTALRLVPRAEAPSRMQTSTERPAQALRAVFADLDLPPWQRAAVPLLVDTGGELVAVADRAYSASFAAWLRARGARLLWQAPADAS